MISTHLEYIVTLKPLIKVNNLPLSSVNLSANYINNTLQMLMFDLFYLLFLSRDVLNCGTKRMNSENI